MGGERVWGVARGCLHGAALVLTAWALVATSAPSPPLVPARDCFTGLPDTPNLQVDLASGSDGGGAPDGGGDDGATDASAGAFADASDDGPSEAGDASDDGPFEASDAGEDGGTDGGQGAGGGDGSSAGGSCYLDPASSDAACALSCNGVDGLTPGTALIFNLEKGARPGSYQQHCFGYTTVGLRGGLAGVTFGLSSGPQAPQDDAFTGAYGQFVSPTDKGCRGDWGLELRPRDAVKPGQLVSPLDAGVAAPWVVVRTMHVPQAQFCGNAFAVRGDVVCGDVFPVDSIAQVSGP